MKHSKKVGAKLIVAGYLLGFSGMTLAHPDHHKAKRFMESLSSQKRQQIQFNSLDHKERTHWFFTPGSREGVTLKELSTAQEKDFFQLLKEHVSPQGIKKTEAIIELERRLSQNSFFGSSYYDPEKYYVTFFGFGGAHQPWAYRFEGHHLSLNFTLYENQARALPVFWGSNPASALTAEKELAFALMRALSHKQQAQAVFAKKAPDEIILTADEQVGFAKQGIAYKDLDAKQKDFMIKLLQAYIQNFSELIAKYYYAAFAENDFADLRFAWAGDISEKKAQYYRIENNRFVIEYANTRNDANHIHCVWRDKLDEFGRTLLKDHYKKSHTP